MAITSRRYKSRLPPSLVIIPDLRGVAFCNTQLRGEGGETFPHFGLRARLLTTVSGYRTVPGAGAQLAPETLAARSEAEKEHSE